MKKFYTYILFILLLLPTIVKAQITTNPEFPNVNSEITITFDSSQESKLGSFSGDLYAHTGVIIKGNTEWQHIIGTWGDNSVQPKLTNNNDGTYTLVITPNITEYYSVASGEVVEQIALVFRSADGNQQTNDLFIDVYEEGLNVSFSSPTNNSRFAKNEIIQVDIKSNISESLSLYLDETLVENTTSKQEISTTVQSNIIGEHKLIAVANYGDEEARDTIDFCIREDVIVENMPTGIIEGINYIDDTTVTLAIYAPKKDYAYVIGDFTNWEVDDTYQMKKDGDYYWITLENLTVGKEYIFQYVIDGDVKIADPYADKILDPWNDEYISDSTYPNLITYPSDKTTEIASVFQTGQSTYNWTDSQFTMPAKEDLVIYELLIRDFTDAGNIKTVTDTLDYLQRLGVNTIELMPFNEFDGNDSWGYNPAFYFAPDKAYGTKDDYKNFINECHKRGIAVFMDMVLNHTYSQSPFLRMYFDGTNPTIDNPWYNVTNNFQNPDAQWGYDINHESEATQKLVDRINAYWINEYHIDGFRFDFTKGFSNTTYGTSSWGSDYDADRIRILKRMSDEIWKVKSDAVVIFEHLADNSEETELANHGILLWGNANGNYNEATMGSNESGKSDLSWTSWKQRGWDAPRVVNYMESHDEERLMYKNLTYGNSSGDYDVTNLSTALSRIEAAAAFFFTIPGPKMVWQFGELGYDISIDEGGRTSKKPILWEYQNDSDRKKLNEVFSALIKIKKEEVAFESNDFTLITSSALKRIEINHADMDVRVIGNFDVEVGEINPNFSKTGTWYDYFSGQEISVSDINAKISLEPGEYHIYTTKQLTPPDIAAAPIASNVKISGTFQEDELLTASYDYSDINDDLEGTSTYQWYRADDTSGTNETAINGANELTYTLGAEDRYKYIRFSVTPVALSGELLNGTIAYSEYTDEIASLYTAPMASNVNISGIFREDETLTANYTYSDVENDLEGNSIYQWYRAEDNNGTNEEAISDATGLSYTLVRADRANFVRFSVTPIAQTGELLQGNTIYSDYSDEIAYSTSINDILDLELSMYPNPVRDILHIENMKDVKSLQLFEISGKLLMALNTPNESAEIDLSKLSKGMYIMVFEMEDQSKLSRKIIVQ